MIITVMIIISDTEYGRLPALAARVTVTPRLPGPGAGLATPTAEARHWPGTVTQAGTLRNFTDSKSELECVRVGAVASTY